jgi:hypothetical protein
MLRTILSAACASALLAGAAYAQSASSPTQDSTVKDPARMEKPGWTNQSGAQTQPYPSKSGTPSAFDKQEQKAMDAVSGDKAMDRRHKSMSSEEKAMDRRHKSMSSDEKAMDRRHKTTDSKMDRSRSTSSTGASTSSIAPECSSMAREEEVTRCLNRHMAELAARGEAPTTR